MLTSWSDVRPVFLDLNFCSNSVVVIGLRIRYRLTASSVIPDSLKNTKHVINVINVACLLFDANTKTHFAPDMYDVAGTRLKLSNFNFFACDKSGDLLCFLFRESETPDAAGVGVADLELCALLGFLLSFSFKPESESDSESLEKSLEESFPDADFF